MSAYSLDLREKIVESVKKGVPKGPRAPAVSASTVPPSNATASSSRSTVPSNPAEGPSQGTEAGREGQDSPPGGPPTEVVGERASFEIPRNRGKNTTLLRSIDALEGWDHPWPWKGAPHPVPRRSYYERRCQK